MFKELSQLIRIFFRKKSGKGSSNIGTKQSYTFWILYFFLQPSFSDLSTSKFTFPHQFKLSIQVFQVVIRISQTANYFMRAQQGILCVVSQIIWNWLKVETVWHQKYPDKVYSPVLCQKKGLVTLLLCFPFSCYRRWDKPADFSICFQFRSRYD